jgi:hypothetical protein
LGIASSGSSSSAEILVDAGGVLDVDDQFTNGVNGSIDYAGGTLQLERSFTNNGSFTTGSSSLLEFVDAGGASAALGGDFSGGNSLQNLTVRANAIVDPADALSNSGSGEPVEVDGVLTIESGGTYGTGDASTGDVTEGSDMTYNGDDFNANGDLFVNRVDFAGGNTTSNPTVVEGAVFGEVRVINLTAVQVGVLNFDVIGVVRINDDSTLDVADKTLNLFGDFLVNGTLNATSGAVVFKGEGRETCCSLDGSELDSSSPNDVQDVTGNANVDFGGLQIRDDDGSTNTTPDTKVEIAGSSSATIVSGDFLIDEATLTTNRPLTLQGNFTVQNNGDFVLSGIIS